MNGFLSLHRFKSLTPIEPSVHRYEQRFDPDYDDDAGGSDGATAAAAAEALRCAAGDVSGLAQQRQAKKSQQNRSRGEECKGKGKGARKGQKQLEHRVRGFR